MSDSDPLKYWAFISYSHRDRRWAEWLLRRLEGYRLPQALVGRQTRDGPLPRRLFPVFRDRDELASSSELGVEVERALRASRYLVVICSPHSARSHWVNEEIRYFKSLGREDRVRCFIVDGEPLRGDARECFASALLQRLDGTPSEPIAADARAQGDGRERARLKLIAGLVGVGYDELRRRDLLARNRRLALLAGVATITSVVTVSLAVAAYFARAAAEHSRQQAEDLIGFMLGDLRARLEPVGRLDVLDAVGEKAMQYFASESAGTSGDATLAARARALRQIGEIRVQQGRLADAAPSFAAALSLAQDLARRAPQDPQALFERGQAEYWSGYAAWLQNDFTTAQTQFRAYRDSAQRLLELQPERPQWLQELAYGESNLGTLAEARGELDTALGHFQAAQAIAATLAQRFPDSSSYQTDYATSLSWLAAVQEQRGQHVAAQALLLEQGAVLRSLMLQQPKDQTLRYQYLQPLLLLLSLQTRSGDLQGYAARSDEALQLATALVAHDPANLDWRAALQQAHEWRALGYELRQQWPQALQEARLSLEQADAIQQSDPGQTLWLRQQLRAVNQLAELQLQLGEPAQAARTLAARADSARAFKPAAVADLEVRVDHQLLRLELAADEKPDADWAVWMDALRRQAPASADLAQQRWDVLRAGSQTAAGLTPRLDTCGLPQQRLLRFLKRHGLDRATEGCPQPLPSESTRSRTNGHHLNQRPDQ